MSRNRNSALPLIFVYERDADLADVLIRLMIMLWTDLVARRAPDIRGFSSPAELVRAIQSNSGRRIIIIANGTLRQHDLLPTLSVFVANGGVLPPTLIYREDGESMLGLYASFVERQPIIAIEHPVDLDVFVEVFLDIVRIFLPPRRQSLSRRPSPRDPPTTWWERLTALHCVPRMFARRRQPTCPPSARRRIHAPRE